MKLELLSLRAVNCGPLKDVVIDFSHGNGHARPITLLAGANGSGKTTVLELIFSLAESLVNGFDWKKSILSRCEYAQIDLHVDEHPFSIYFGTLPPDVALPYQRFDSKATPARVSKVPYDRTGGLDVADDIRSLIGQNSNGSIDYLAPSDRLIDNSIPSFILFPCQRELRPVDGQNMNREYTLNMWAYRYKSSSSFRGSLDSYLVWLEYAEPEAFERVANFLNNLYPDHKIFEVERRRLRSVVVIANKKHPIDVLSSGEQNILIVLLELYRRLTPHSVVLIDEIENSLHPAFQHRMAQGLLKLQGEIPFQLIATSHAEAFIDVFGTAATRILPMPNYASK